MRGPAQAPGVSPLQVLYTIQLAHVWPSESDALTVLPCCARCAVPRCAVLCRQKAKIRSLEAILGQLQGDLESMQLENEQLREAVSQSFLSFFLVLRLRGGGAGPFVTHSSAG